MTQQEIKSLPSVPLVEAKKYLESRRLKPFQIGIEAAAILFIVTSGRLHNANLEWSSAEAEHDFYFSIRWRSGFCTYDPNMLTGLVVLTLDYGFRLEVKPVLAEEVEEGNDYPLPELELVFHKRNSREGMFYERIPSLEKQAELIRKSAENY